ncbi:hypothetical protein ET006_03525 [Lactococcus garvieae]|uniref:hypothetical protein n=1 Tax=Lactococcus formosensis TaxID=1281486 RepID=UPI0013FD798F|nr:hypothetical protein [Lactococcus formosensis]NHI67773.1 hypothetical protein [Lactococcus garvieae]NHI73189.1 hypothetical protein [Lactococcus garvieae]NHI99106.1 hypothetical protein [Lactococcus garvieae]NHJ18440.1 hypothetical protein [Lactococcus garvieae]
MKKFKLSLLLVSSLAAALLLTACSNTTSAKKDTSSEPSSSVKSSSESTSKASSSETSTSESSDASSTSDSTTATSEAPATSEQPSEPATSESSDQGWVDNSNNPVENNGAGGHSPQADPNATSSSSEATPNGRAWVLVYVDKAGNKHESTVSTSYKELQDKANALLASGEASSYYFIQK